MDAPKHAKQENEKHSLKGTFVSVMIVGAAIVISWFGVFMIFLNRG